MTDPPDALSATPIEEEASSGVKLIDLKRLNVINFSPTTMPHESQYLRTKLNAEALFVSEFIKAE